VQKLFGTERLRVADDDYRRWQADTVMMKRKHAASASTPMPTVDTAISIEELLRTAGYDTPSASQAARRALQTARLTREGKRGIAAYKKTAALEVLASSLVRVCSQACREMAAAGRAPVRSATACEVCANSNNRRAALSAARALRQHGVRRVLIVGGKESQQREIARVFSEHGVALEGVDGTSASHSQKDARAKMGRAQLLVVWGSTPLRHAVSDLYTTEPAPHLRTVRVSRRSIEALCTEIVRTFALQRRIRA
jgi:hypothetical protein